MLERGSNGKEEGQEDCLLDSLRTRNLKGGGLLRSQNLCATSAGA